jgi:hypothetical protein
MKKEINLKKAIVSAFEFFLPYWVLIMETKWILVRK